MQAIRRAPRPSHGALPAGKRAGDFAGDLGQQKTTRFPLLLCNTLGVSRGGKSAGEEAGCTAARNRTSFGSLCSPNDWGWAFPSLAAPCCGAWPTRREKQPRRFHSPKREEGRGAKKNEPQRKATAPPRGLTLGEDKPDKDVNVTRYVVVFLKKVSSPSPPPSTPLSPSQKEA